MPDFKALFTSLLSLFYSKQEADEVSTLSYAANTWTDIDFSTTSYTATKTGWIKIAVDKGSETLTQFELAITNNLSYRTTNGTWIVVCIPMKKGDQLTINKLAGNQITQFQFFPSVGSS